MQISATQHHIAAVAARSMDAKMSINFTLVASRESSFLFEFDSSKSYFPFCRNLSVAL